MHEEGRFVADPLNKCAQQLSTDRETIQLNLQHEDEIFTIIQKTYMGCYYIIEEGSDVVLSGYIRPVQYTT